MQMKKPPPGARVSIEQHHQHWSQAIPNDSAKKPSPGVGAGHGHDLRHVTLNNPAEEKLFHAVIQESDWMADESTQSWAAPAVLVK